MLRNQELALQQAQSRNFLGAALLTAVMLAGCASGNPFRRGAAMDDADPASVRRSAPMDDAAAPSEPEITATEAAVARSPEDAPASEPAPVQSIVKADAPASYTVQRGDTLWDLANLFLRDPWLWPEIWQVNPQVENPHLIYPGDVLTLAYGANGQPQIQLTRGGGARLEPRLRTEPLDGAIATIPYAAIASFLERPSILSSDQIRVAPRVLGFRDGHMIGGTGHEAYVAGLARRSEGARYNIYRVGEKVVDPESGDTLGFMGVYAATAVVERSGNPSKVLLEDSARETLQGDPLISGDTDVPLNFLPRSPNKDIDGEIVAVVDGTQLIGQYRIVALNRGADHGLEIGHVLVVDQAGDTIRDTGRPRFAGMKLKGVFSPKVTLPNERAGSLLVFKVFDRLSYGLTVATSAPIAIGDRIRTP
jgi:hypothetical protein